MPDPYSSESRGAAYPTWFPWIIWLFLSAFALVLFLVFFNPLSTVLLGILAATIVASTLDPLLRYIPGPRALAAAVLGLSLIAAVAALLTIVSLSLSQPIQKEFRDWPQTKKDVDNFLVKWSTEIGLQEPMSADKLVTGISKFFAGEGGQALFTRSADVSLGILIWLAFIFIGSIFFLADPQDRLLNPAITVVSPRHRPAVRLLLNELAPKYRRWVCGTFLSMCIVFGASAVGYASIGLPLALPLALLAGLCEIVPTVGPATACVIAALFAAATNGGGAVLGVLAVYAIIQSIEAYFILPLIMRGAVKVHPAVTLFSVVLWGKIFGIPGLMLAIPINLTLAAAIDHLYVRPRDRRCALASETVAMQ